LLILVELLTITVLTFFCFVDIDGIVDHHWLNFHCFVDIDRIVDHHCLNFLFIIESTKRKDFLKNTLEGIYSWWTASYLFQSKMMELWRVKYHDYYFISREAASSASFLDIYLEFDTKDILSIRTLWQRRRDDIKFAMINFPHLYSNIPTFPAYGGYISQLIRYAGSCCFNI
jgi:hypothetical protein